MRRNYKLGPKGVINLALDADQFVSVYIPNRTFDVFVARIRMILSAQLCF